MSHGTIFTRDLFSCPSTPKQTRTRHPRAHHRNDSYINAIDTLPCYNGLHYHAFVLCHTAMSFPASRATKSPPLCDKPLVSPANRHAAFSALPLLHISHRHTLYPTLLSTIPIRATPLVNHLQVSRLSSCHSNLSCQLSQYVPHHLSTIYGCHVSVRVIKIIRQTSYGCPASKFAALVRQTSYGCPASKFAALGPSRPDPLPPAVVCWPLRREPDMKGLFRSDLENFCGLF